MKFCLCGNMKKIIPCSQIGMKEVVRGLHGCKLEGEQSYLFSLEKLFHAVSTLREGNLLLREC